MRGSGRPERFRRLGSAGKKTNRHFYRFGKKELRNLIDERGTESRVRLNIYSSRVTHPRSRVTK
jgi:hypothetical protein